MPEQITLTYKTSTEADRLAELKEFLRTRRERISPTQAGLPSRSHRRTPGLRREEVALLAGVGVTWYTRLEQGKPITVSSQVLDSLATVLQLSEVERLHLLLWRVRKCRWFPTLPRLSQLIYPYSNFSMPLQFSRSC